jgi:hypothetical protein
VASAGYSKTPLVQKLGIKPDTTLVLLDAPVGFRRELKGLPSGVRVVTRPVASARLSVWFVRSATSLNERVATMAPATGSGLWIAWPKKASGIHTDVTEQTVREAGLANDLVDYKVCAINEVWSGLKFARRSAR